jgi:hypothetical protein
MSIVVSYFAVEHIFTYVIMSAFQKITLYIAFFGSLLLFVSPRFLAKQNNEQERLIQTFETSLQEYIKRKKRKTFYIVFAITCFIAGIFSRLVYKDIVWWSLQESIAHIFIGIGFFSLFGYPIIILRTRNLVFKNI